MAGTGTGSAKRTVLVVDDERDVRDLLERLLSGAGYRVVVSANGLEGVKAFYDLRPDLVLLDIRMPQLDGRQVLQRIREVAATPVIMLTGLGLETDKVQALRGGADDYLVKPFGRDELLARCEAVLRRAQRPRPAGAFEDDGLRIDFVRHEVLFKGSSIDLSPLEFRLLGALVRHAGKAVTGEELIKETWDDGYGTQEGLRVYIGYLRKKLGAAGERITSIRGFGYRYEGAPVSGT
ncbi:MAG: response regulator transcription factor [Chloroflexi bacterium]|nr:response regulator transcription factor [Chloroflexota bacterium]